MPDERAKGDSEITFTLINNDTEISVSRCFLDAFMLYAKAQASQAAFHLSTTCPLLQRCILPIFRRNRTNDINRMGREVKIRPSMLVHTR